MKKLIYRKLIFVFFLLFLTGCDFFSTTTMESTNLTQAVQTTTTNVNTILTSPLTDFDFTLKSDDTYEMTQYIGSETDVSIPSVYQGKPVTSIGDFAFYYSENVEFITIPSTINEIGLRSFYVCNNLKAIDVDSNNAYYSSIDGVLFNKGQTILMKYPSQKVSSEYSIPEGTISVNSLSFIYNNYLESVNIPASIERLGEVIFGSCINLENIFVSDSNHYYSDVEGVLFNKDQSILIHHPINSELIDYIVPEGVIRIEHDAFSQNVNLTSISFPDSLLEIGRQAFLECENLTELNLPENLVNVDDFAFSFCNQITDIFIPASVSSFSSSAFAYTTSFELFTVDENNNNYSTIDGILFVKEKNILVTYPAGRTDDSYIIPSDVWFIPSFAFCGNLYLEYVYIPDSVTRIDGAVFHECDNLIIYTSLTEPNEEWDDGWNSDNLLVEWGEVNMSTATISFDENGGTEIVDITDSIGSTITEPALSFKEGYSFIGWFSDSSLTDEFTFEIMPNDNITLYAKWTPWVEDSTDLYEFTLKDDDTYEVTAYDGTSIEAIVPSIYEGKAVTSISSWAFEAKDTIEIVILPDSIVSIGYYAFHNCPKLSTIYIPSSVTTIDTQAISRCWKLRRFVVNTDNEYFADEDGILFNKDMTVLYRYPEGLDYSEYTIPDHVTGIGDWAFYYCNQLTEITLSEYIDDIGYAAFTYANNLETINIDENNNHYLSDDSVVYTYDKSLLVAYPNGKTDNLFIVESYVREIKANSFSGSNFLEYVIIREGTTTIGNHAFREMPLLKEITLPDSLEIVGDYVFAHDPSLTQLYFSYRVREIGYATFYDTPNIMRIDVDQNNPYFMTYDGILYNKEQTTLIHHPAKKLDKMFIVPSTVTLIREDGLCSNQYLIAIYIPETVEQILKYGVAHCYNVTIYTEYTEAPDNWEFQWNYSNVDIHWGAQGAGIYNDDLNYIIKNDGMVIITGQFEDSTTADLIIPTEIDGHRVDEVAAKSFEENYRAETIFIPVEIELIEAYAFNDSSLTIYAEAIEGTVSWNPDWNIDGNTVYWNQPSTTSTISFNTDGGRPVGSIYDEIGSVVLAPDSPVKAGFEFAGWYSDSGLNTEYTFTTMPSDDLVLYAKWVSIVPEETDFQFSLKYDNDYEYFISGYTGTDSDIITPETYNGLPVTGIGFNGFFGNESIVTITVTSNIKTIFMCAFRDLPNLTTINIPAGVETIEPEAFKDTPNLVNLNIDEDNEYYLCDNLVLFNKDKTILIEYFAWKPDTSYQIPKTVIVISKGAFQDADNLENVTMPCGVERLSDDVFFDCDNLTSIVFPDSITTLGGAIFYGCSNLTSVILSNNITEIPSNMFNGNTSLTSINIPDSVTVIDTNAFFRCTNLQEVNIPDSIISINNGAFNDCESITSINLPEGLKNIGDNAFSGCMNISSVYIPSTVEAIGSQAFAPYCESLTEINVSLDNQHFKSIDGILFNYDLTTIMQYPQGKILTSYTVPDSVTTIAIAAFQGNNQLTELIIPDSVTRIEDLAIQGCQNLEYMIIPNSVTYLGNHAFSSNINMLYVLIPDSVSVIDSSAFAICSKLTIFTEYPSKPEGWEDNWNWSNRPVRWSYIEKQITIAFNTNGGSDVPSLTQIELSVAEIPDDPIKSGYQFMGWYEESELINLYVFGVMPENDITLYAKWEATEVTVTFESNGGSELSSMTLNVGATLTLPPDPTKDGYDFMGWYVDAALTNAFDLITMPSYDLTLYAKWMLKESTITFDSMGGTYVNPIVAAEGDVISDPDVPTKVDFIFTGWYTETEFINEYIFTTMPVDDLTLYAKWVSPYQVTIDDMVFEVIGDEAVLISYNGSATDIIIPNTVDEANVIGIDDDAFSWNSDLTTIVFPDTLTSIGTSAFLYNNSLISVIIPSNVTNIGDSAFLGCSSLTAAVIHMTTTEVGDSAFDNCRNLTIYYEGDTIPSTWNTNWNPDNQPIFMNYIETIDNGEFIYATSSDNKAILIGLSLTNSDSEIVIPESFGIYTVSEIRIRAFADNSQITSITIPSGVSEIYKETFNSMSNLVEVIFASGSNLTTIGKDAFSWNGDLTTIVFPDTLTSIGTSAFLYNSSLISVIIPSNVTNIGDSAFLGCSSLTAAVIHMTTTEVGDSAFDNCRNLTIYYEGDTIPSTWNTNWNPDNQPIFMNYIETIDNGEFIYATSSDNKAILIGLSLTNSDSEIVIPESFGIYTVSEIRIRAFADNSQITSFTIPSGVSEIYKETFNGMSNLVEIFFASGSNLTTIGKAAFSWNSDLTTIVFPDTLTSIGEGAFFNTSSLASLIIPINVTYIGDNAFGYCGVSVINIVASDVPSTWDPNWNPDGITVSTNYIE